MKIRSLLALALVLLILPGCAPKLKIFAAPTTQPLKEMVIEGDGDGKIALIHLKGFLQSQPKQGMLRATPSPLQELVSALRLAEVDPEVRGVVIAIDSPGGTATASDIIYHELMAFKQRSGKKVIAIMFDVAASGGYYAALGADWIMAHPTTITGSVGVIFMRPKVHSLLDKVGVDVEVSKSGNDKDMGSPFRPTTKQEKQLFQAIINDYAGRFHALVLKHRKLTPSSMSLVKTARVFTARQAKSIGLIDQIGYMQDVFVRARQFSGLPANAKIVTYRRDIYPNDNPYNSLTATDMNKANLLGIDASALMPPKAGFYYVWPQGMSQ